ncbi:MAG: hypothetical protein DA405_02050 [Bacteroidetes bacterium]|nr:MAG: hypothetical protein DA405_02050 [Bacteroidota bacterium]
MLAIALLALLSTEHRPKKTSGGEQIIATTSKTKMTVHFKNVENEKIKNSFLEVMRRYTELHNSEVTLVQGPLKSSTMQAQPVIKLAHLFSETQKYHVKLAHLVRDSKELKVADLPAEVLTGWFAHELGHLVDYRPYNNFQMILFGLKYVFLKSFKKEAEHAADYIAIRHGFRSEIIATKRFILENDLLEESYKAKIRRYCMPIEEAEVWEHEHVPGTPEAEI